MNDLFITLGCALPELKQGGIWPLVNPSMTYPVLWTLTPKCLHHSVAKRFLESLASQYDRRCITCFLSHGVCEQKTVSLVACSEGLCRRTKNNYFVHLN